MQTIVPYLTVSGASEASAFYQKAFDATENARHPAEDGKRLMHVALSIHGGDVFLCDEFPEHGGAPAPTAERPAPVQITIQLKTPQDVDAVFAKAVKAGAVGIMEPADMFWNARFAQLRDPFGCRRTIIGECVCIVWVLYLVCYGPALVLRHPPSNFG